MRRPHLTAAIAYAAVTVLYFARILSDPTRMASFLYGDGFAMLWNLWWAKRSVTTLQSPFATDVLSWPHEASLVFHPLDPFEGTW